jgi:hypothetical protein
VHKRTPEQDRAIDEAIFHVEQLIRLRASRERIEIAIVQAGMTIIADPENTVEWQDVTEMQKRVQKGVDLGDASCTCHACIEYRRIVALEAEMAAEAMGAVLS